MHRPDFLFFLSCFFLIPAWLFAQGNTCLEAIVITPDGTFQADGPSSGQGCYQCSPGNPGGIPAQHADWFRFRLPQAGSISIASCDGGADTRLWLYQGNCDSLVLLAQNDDACDFEPGQPYAAAITDWFLEAGVDYFLEWDDAWDRNPFTFTFTFVPSQRNLKVEGGQLPFTKIPGSQLRQDGIPLQMRISNLGSLTESGIVALTEIIDSSNVAVFSDTLRSVMLAPNEKRNIQLGKIMNLVPGHYFIRQGIRLSQPDDFPVDDLVVSPVFEVTATQFAQDDGNFVGGLGIDGPGHITQGQFFDFFHADTLQGMFVNTNGGLPGDSIVAEIWNFNSLNGQPGILLQRSKAFILGESDPDWKFLTFDRPFPVSRGERFFFALTHFASGFGINLGLTETLFRPGNAWLSINQQPWISLESLSDPSVGNLEFAYGIRPEREVPEVKVNFQVDLGELSVRPEGVYLQLWRDGHNLENVAMVQAFGNLWRTDVSVAVVDTFFYRFSNGHPDSSSHLETLPLDCSTELVNGNWRVGQSYWSDQTMEKVCFGACRICPLPACARSQDIICDDFETYNPGDITLQSVHWGVWDASSEGGIVSADLSNSGEHSMKIEGTLPDGGSQDVLLLLGDHNTGRKEILFHLWVPDGKAAYFNIQHQILPEHIAGFDFYFDPGNSGEIWLGNQKYSSFTFPSDEWMALSLEVDLDNDLLIAKINGRTIFQGIFSLAAKVNGQPASPVRKLAALNFYPLSQEYLFYLDDVLFRALEPLPGNTCQTAFDISPLLGRGPGVNVRSGPWDNKGHFPSLWDPVRGMECFGETFAPDPAYPIQNPVWFEFQGDGNTYEITMPMPDSFTCLSNQSLHLAFPQLALFKGQCGGNLIPIQCSEGLWPEFTPSILFTTEAGESYFLLVDGNLQEGPTEGNFCLQFTQQRLPEEPSVVTFQVNMTRFLEAGNNLSPEGIFIAGNFSSYSALPMADRGGGVWARTDTFARFDTLYFKFFNGNDGAEIPQNSSQTCFFQTDFLEDYRLLILSIRDTVLAPVCFGYCEECDKISSVLFPEESEDGITLFPNPAKNKVYFKAPENWTCNQITLINSLGNTVKEWRPGQILPSELNLEGLQEGFWLLRFYLGPGNIITKRILISH